jgi:nucleoside-diphosphate-sugar epimerase
MSVLLTGATGHVGSAVLRSLVAHDHEVVALVRTEAKADQVRAAGASPVVGDLTDLALLERLIRASDGVIHTASPGDASSAQVDGDIVDVAIRALAGTHTPYVHTGGVWVFGSGSDIVESDPFAPPALTAWRIEVESRLRASDVRSTIIAPSIVHGYGLGIPTIFTGGDEVRLVGAGTQHWGTVHSDDLAELYVLALDAAAADEYYLGTSGDNPTVREIAEAAAHGRPVVAESDDESRARLGAAFADALLLDQQASGRHARETLGWVPTRPTLPEEFRSASDATA